MPLAAAVTIASIALLFLLRLRVKENSLEASFSDLVWSCAALLAAIAAWMYVLVPSLDFDQLVSAGEQVAGSLVGWALLLSAVLFFSRQVLFRRAADDEMRERAARLRKYVYSEVLSGNDAGGSQDAPSSDDPDDAPGALYDEAPDAPADGAAGRGSTEDAGDGGDEAGSPS